MPVEWERIRGGLAEDFRALDGDEVSGGAVRDGRDRIVRHGLGVAGLALSCESMRSPDDDRVS
jgi:hypothetical protein